jgi:hypothetical protein
MKIFIRSCGLIINTDHVISANIGEVYRDGSLEINIVMSSGEVFSLTSKDKASRVNIYSAIMSSGKNMKILDDIEFGYGRKVIK